MYKHMEMYVFPPLFKLGGSVLYPLEGISFCILLEFKGKKRNQLVFNPYPCIYTPKPRTQKK